jgi:DnaJ domain
MFERNRIDTKDHNSTTTSVEIVLEGGEVVHGRVFHSVTRSVGEELNGPALFLDFEQAGHGRTWLTKRSIQSLSLTSIPRADQLDRVIKGADAMNPYLVLNVAADADKEAIREAYHRMVRLYHPDRFITVELPPEMRDYVNAMARRINVAYATLTGTKQTRATAAA